MSVVLMVALVIPGCGPPGAGPTPTGPSGAPQEGGTLRVAITGYPPSMDPITSWAGLGILVFQHVAEGLLTYDEAWQIIPQLAEEYYSNEDDTEWTIELRQGVMFHHGREMDAHDVKATFLRFQEASPRAGDLADLERVEVLDDYTVKLVMSQPSPILPALLAYPMAGILVMPREVLEGAEAGPLPPDQIIGTGPYRLVDAVPDQFILLEKFTDYVPDTRWEGPTGLGGYTTAYLDQIRFIPVPEMASRVAGIMAGDYDFAQDIHKAEHDEIVLRPGITPAIIPAQWMPVVYFNRLKAPFDDVNMRRAVQVALDHEELMLAAAHQEEFFRLDCSMFLQEQVWHHPVGCELGLYNEADGERAAGLLQQAGYQGDPIIILTNRDYDWMYRIGVVMTEQLEDVGFNVQLEVYDWPTAVEVRSRGAWDVFISGDQIPFDPSYYNFWRSDQWLMMPTVNFDAIMDEVVSHTDFDVRFEWAKRLQEAIYDEVIQIKLGDMHEMHAVTDRVKNFQPHWTLRFWDVWLE